MQVHFIEEFYDISYVNLLMECLGFICCIILGPISVGAVTNQRNGGHGLEEWEWEDAILIYCEDGTHRSSAAANQLGRRRCRFRG